MKRKIKKEKERNTQEKSAVNNSPQIVLMYINLLIELRVVDARNGTEIICGKRELFQSGGEVSYMLFYHFN